MDCEYRQYKNKWKCSRCNHVVAVRGPKPPHRKCRRGSRHICRSEDLEKLAEATGDHTLLERGGRWAKAVAKWTAAGWPVRADEEVAACHAVCQICEKYDHSKQTCKVCGCKVTAKGMAIRNKAKMATEDCVRGKWPKLITNTDRLVVDGNHAIEKDSAGRPVVPVGAGDG